MVSDNNRVLILGMAFICAMIVAVGSLIVIPLGHKASCSEVKRGRRQGNERARVLLEFIEDARIARATAAKHETGAQRENDIATARRYAQLEKRVIVLPVTC